MKRKVGIIAAAAILAAVLLWSLWPRSFQTAMHSGFDSEEISGVQVVLTGVLAKETAHETIEYSIPADDPAYQELVHLLESKHYFPLLPTAGMGGWDVTLNYIVQLYFYNDTANYSMYLSGDHAIYFHGTPSNTERFRYFRTSGGEAFQQEILDFLLAHIPSEQQSQE